MSIFGKGSEAGFLFEIKGAPALEVVSFIADEQLSKPFVANITFASLSEIQFDSAIQKEALLTIKGVTADRYLHGIVREFQYTGKSGLKHLYHVQIVPASQLLSLEQDCRIFQQQNIQDIIATIFKDSHINTDRYEFRLQNKDHKRRFCVQYRETDADFVERLLQEEGIYYFFEHSKDKHLLVFADDPSRYKPIAGDTNITFKPASGLTPTAEAISEIDFAHQLSSGMYTQTNYNFKRTDLPMETAEKSKEERIQKYEVYDYPGQYADTDRGKKLAKVRLEENVALADQAHGSSNCPRLVPGFTFKLYDHDLGDLNKEYFVIGLSHAGQQPQTLEEQAGAGGGTTYNNDFTAIPSAIPYRPARNISKPYVKGMQSAAVVGPQNEEIYVDEHGRVKVQFHWDREGKNDEKSSCWLRCAQAWGGNGWGTVFIPRIGDEVLVDFMEGDPDWPIIVGSVYNGEKKPLYDLPANKTRSTIKTKSYPNSNGFNELRFEDKSGDEEIYIHGEKDWNIIIKNDKGQNIGHDETLHVVSNRTKTVGVDQSETVGVNKTITVGVNHTESIGANMTRSIGAFKTDTTAINSAETIGAAKELTVGGLYQVSVGGIMNETVGGAKSEEVGGIKAVLVGAHMTEKVFGNRTSDTKDTHTMKAKKFSFVAQEEIYLTTGSASITMKSSGDIEIKGSNVDVKGAGDVTVKGQKVSSN